MRIFLIACVAVVLSGCSTSAQEGAGKGATMGMVGGAVAGAVGSLLWGGNVVEGAAKGAAVGAASGAATGAVSGSMRDSARKNEPKPKPAAVDQAELRRKMGDRNYATTVLLTQCRHQDAIASAQDTLAASQSKDERVYALLIQGIAAEESGNKALASTAYSKIVQEDAARGSVDKVRADALEGVMKVQATRRDHGLSPLCKA
jgi:predicted DNA-binding WGR domain protein